MTSVAENDVSTLGLGLDMESRYLEAEKVCHQGFKDSVTDVVSWSTLTLGRLVKHDMWHLNIWLIVLSCNANTMSNAGNAFQENL